MRARFICYLLASVTLHLIVLALPISVTMGGFGTGGTLPVRVHLLADTGTSPAGNASAGASSNTDSLAAARDASRAIEAPHPPLPRETIERPAVAARQTETTHRTSAIRSGPSTPAPRPETATQPAGAAPKKRQAKKAATGIARREKTERRQKTSASKQRVLRTTSVYAGSARTATPTNQAPAGTQRSGSATAGAERASGEISEQAGAERSEHVRYAKVVKPTYPEQARAQGWEGTAVLRVLVSQSGKSADIEVQRSSGFDLLDDAAVEALRLWQFHPARRGRIAVQSWVSVPVVFKLEEDH